MTDHLLPLAPKSPLIRDHPRPTMRDVAQLAGGVHPSTVSLALRNHPGISEATRKRVRAAARKLGYRPDPLLDAFNTHRLEVLPHKALPVIAFISDFESRQALEKSSHHGPLWTGARAAADTLHCQIELFLMGKGQLTPERIHTILRARGIVSIVIGACRPLTTRVPFDWADYSAVKIESPHITVPLYTVSSDQRQAARLAYRNLYALGYRRIGLATFPGADGRHDEQYRAGYFLEQSRAQGATTIIPLATKPETPLDIVRQWIREQNIEAVISDDISFAEMVRHTGVGSSHNPAFVCLDLPENSSDVAGIVVDHARIGAQAVEQVVGLMRTNQRGLPGTASCTYVPVAWRDGASAPHRPTKPTIV